MTSDQALFEISRIKKNISKGLLRAIKETSMDCSIHNKSNSKEGLVCYTFSSPSENAYSYKKGYTTEEQDVVSKINRKKIKWKAFKITIQGTVYAIRYDMGNVGLGYIKVETSYKEGTNTSASTSEHDIFGASYNLGGGVLFEVSHGTKEEVGGADSLKDTEADATLAKLSFGF